MMLFNWVERSEGVWFVRKSVRADTGEIVEMKKMKRCSVCGTEKDVTEFWKLKGGKDGLNSQCKSCLNEARRIRRKHFAARGRSFYDTVDESSLKRCYKCDKLKPLTEFRRRLREKDGFADECLECDTFGFKRDAWNGRVWRISRHIGRINATNEELDALYEATPYCAYCKVPLAKHEVSIDHKEPLNRDRNNDEKKSIHNLAICCYPCNRLKGTMNVEEFMRFLMEYRERLNAL